MPQLAPSSPMQQLAVDTFMKVDVLVLGGAVFGGKTYLATMLSTLYATDPDARIAVFRRTLGEMSQGGGVIDTFSNIYDQLGDSCKLKITRGNSPIGRIMSGPGAGKRKGEGCRIEFKYMDGNGALEKVRGGAYSLAIIEEATPFFTQEEIEMIDSRLRPFGNSQHDPKLIITCNPYKDHYVCDMIKGYYLDAEGYPITERCGHVRYYMKYDNEYYWGDSKQEVVDLVDPLGAFSYVDLTDEEKLQRVKSFSFVQLVAKDNPIGMAKRPEYMANLEGLSGVKKARDLYGNWFVEEEGGSVFNRSMVRGENGIKVKTIKDLPYGCVALRGVDKAYSEPSDRNTDPDYTAISPLLLKDRDGMYWLMGNYNTDVTDKIPFKKSDTPLVGRFRKLPGERDSLIALQLNTDKVNQHSYNYSTPKLALSKDNGGGSGDFYETLTRMAEAGIEVVKDKSVSNVTGKKMTDFLAFTSACEQGLVNIIEESFCPIMLEAWYKELERFDGSNSGRTRKDDHVDAIALAYNCMRDLKRPYRTINMSQNTGRTLSAHLITR